MGKKPKKNFGKGSSNSESAKFSANLMSRPEFLKSAGLAAAGIGAAAVGMGGVGKAQEAPDYTLAEMVKTLAALVDTYVPGKKNEPVLILPTGDLMTNLGAVGTDTPGAAFLPSYMVDGVTYSVYPAYLYLGQVFPHYGLSVNDVIGLLDRLTNIFNPEKKFYQLPYEDEFENGERVGWGRYHILYMMEKPDLLIPLLMFMGGYSQEQAAGEAAEANNIFRQGGFSIYSVYFSEVCNIIPSAHGPEEPVGPDMKLIHPPYAYSRVEQSDPSGELKYSWNIIPYSIWDQSGFPGPSYKNPDFVSGYEGMKVKISDGKVNFIK